VTLRPGISAYSACTRLVSAGIVSVRVSGFTLFAIARRTPPRRRVVPSQRAECQWLSVERCVVVPTGSFQYEGRVST
jgi:hypothetical protein